ncbi:MAG TPA: 50S ribosomal protein L10 [Bryobacteraceae bacterium]|jgi:large subunit ribosomal protein L10|nr:50S ribosomal protein L10 [Bryobacteraceae bacterium]
MKNKDDKSKDLEHLRKEFEQDPTIFITGYEKMTVQQDFDLRKTVRDAGGKYKVVKNNLAAKASEGLKSQEVFDALKGMTSIAYTTSDPVALAKALTSYAKNVPAFTFKAGFVEGRVVEVKSIQDLANMPSKEELIAKVMFLINSGAQRLAVSLNGVARNLAVVIDQAAKEGKFKEG